MEPKTRPRLHAPDHRPAGTYGDADPGGPDPLDASWFSSDDGPWHYVGDAGEPAFQNGCVNIDGEERLRFRLKANGVDVDIDGAFDPGDQTDIVVFTLPAGYRPLEKVDLVLALTTDDGFALVELRPDGDVFFYGMFYGTPGSNQQGQTVGQTVFVNGA